ncbi:PREDICTED: peroxisomal N(1)-acetyl-spermine/spermidine oxidase-like, partial [Priapulus caudatus]|uniref:Peroxisomal N(1)-acetyl-spermine/spermidine oxidase-like n=1 Tax=Priapulus caudatus TaxID=37621 RepID=A0ABM1F594_PRICU
GNVLELGANWIHGVLTNPVFEMAYKMGLVNIHKGKSRTYNVMACTDVGGFVPVPVVDEVRRHYYQLFNVACQYHTLRSPLNGLASVGEFLRRECDRWLADNWPTDGAERRRRRVVFAQLMRRETSICGVDSLDELDLAEIGSYAELPGGNVRIDDGYANIVAGIADQLPEGVVELGRAVTRIVWEGGEGEGEGVRVECGEETTYRCERVLVAVSLGYLQRHQAALFDPSLPEEKVAAMSRIGFGNVNKLFLEFAPGEMSFLDPTLHEVLMLWGADGEWTEDAGDRKPPVTADNWYKKIYSFKVVAPNVLCGWLAGRESEFMETLTEDEVLETCWALLKRFLTNPDVPRPISCKR